MAKSKKLGTNLPVPQSQGDCEISIRKLGNMRRKVDRIEADMNDELAKIKDAFGKKAAPLRDEAEALLGGIEIYCAAHRATLTQNGKVKFARFVNGEVKWRIRPPKVTVRGVDAVLDALKGLGLSRFVRTSEVINKDAILNEPDAVKGVAGISIGSEGEDFVVEPFEADMPDTKEKVTKAAS